MCASSVNVSDAHTTLVVIQPLNHKEDPRYRERLDFPTLLWEVGYLHHLHLVLFVDCWRWSANYFSDLSIADICDGAAWPREGNMLLNDNCNDAKERETERCTEYRVSLGGKLV